jgi:hypothetical protein
VGARDYVFDSIFQEAMLASAKSKAHKAFKNGNYLVATKIYDEVCVFASCLLKYGHIDCSQQFKDL